MEMIVIDPSQSSQIAQIGHDGKDLCHVLFRRGGLYEHGNVDATFFTRFKDSLRPGEFYAQNLRNRQPYQKLGDGVSAAPKAVEAGKPSAADLDAVAAEQQIAALTSSAPENQNQEVEKVAEQSSALVHNATSIKVVDETTQSRASEMLLAVAAMLKQIETTFKPMKDAAFKTHRTICDQEKTVAGPLQQAEKVLKEQIGTFVQEQRRIAREAEEELRRQEQERADREAQEESQRLAINDAVNLEAQGDMQAAEAVLNNPAPVPSRYIAPAPIAARVAQVFGVSTSMSWDFRITNEAVIPRDFMLPNESLIRSTGKNSKGKVKIAGIEFYEKPVVAASRGGRI